MTEHPAGKFVWVVPTVLALALPLIAEARVVRPASGAGLAYDDVHISGLQINAFADGDESVSVVLGHFKLRIGRRVITGRDAVVWVRESHVGRAVLHQLTVYVEGDARIVEPNGATSTDEVMLVTLRHQGRLTASGKMSSVPLTNFPLYLRALDARKSGLPRPARPTTMPVHAPTGDAATLPDQPTIPDDEPAKTDEPVAINFHFDSFSSRIRDARRYTIARGNVYLARGLPDTEEFLELTSHAAVLISQKRRIQAASVPWAPRLGAGDLGDIDTGLSGPEGAAETLTGVYMEGDVVIRRGERILRCPAAYYDFVTDRALAIDPVFRTVQSERNIPIYIRASEARALSIREMWFKDARISTSDFYNPSYHIGAAEAYVMETTPYDERGVRLAERSMRARYKHATFNIRSVPVLYAPSGRTDFQEGHTSLRRASTGSYRGLGGGVETEWHLFRLLGLVRPKGFSGRFELNWFERGLVVGAKLNYQRPAYSGYWRAFAVVDGDGEDDFGDLRENIPAPGFRGRVLVRHKQFLPNDWQVQLELSYISDRNFLEAFFPDEFFAGKEQETLLYARKQRDNWAVTSLFRWRLNRFQTQTEAVPDLGLFLVGEPLLSDRLTLFSETQVGLLQERFDNSLKVADSDFYPRIESRHEIDWPVKLGPVNVVAYGVGRLRHLFEQDVFEGSDCRQYGQLGIRANTHFWRIYPNVKSRLWNLHKIKHVITPEAIGFISDEAANRNGSDRSADATFGPSDRIGKDQLSGVKFGIHQRWQTKRGPAGDEKVVDWIRWDVDAAWFSNSDEQYAPPSDGRFFLSRPDSSIPRNHVYTDFAWNISDATSILADANYDIDTGKVRRANAGLTLVRDPRQRYYMGLRYIEDVDSLTGTFGLKYRISRKYSLDFFEQYDFDFDGGQNAATIITLTRKLSRWYASFSCVVDSSDDGVGFFITLWPEGLPEVRVGSGRANIFGRSELN